MAAKVLCFVAAVLFVSIDLIGAAPSTNDGQPGELLQFHVLLRHTDRTPVNFYPTDPHKDFDWPEGIGSLTLKGEERAYQFGDVLRKHYQEYLANFLVKNARAQSSPVRRVIETNLALLSGLLPPRPEQFWSNDTELASYWQPVGVEMSSVEKSYALGETGPCPVADKIFSTVDSLQRTKKLFTDNKEFLTNMRQLTEAELVTLKQVGDLYDTLFCEKNYGLKLPDWATDDIMRQLKQFRELEFSIFSDLPQQFLRLKAGPFLKELLANLNGTSTEQRSIAADDKRLFTYSTHDKVLSIILHALGLFKEQPSYGSALLVEVRANPTTRQQSPLLYLYYANSTNNFSIDPLALDISNTLKSHCSQYSCPITNFTEALAPYLPADIESECGVPQTDGAASSGPVFVFTFMLSALASLAFTM